MSTAAAPVGPAEAVAAPAPEERKRGWTGYLLLAPAMLWLLVFFIIPMVSLVSTSLYDPSGSLETGYSMTGHIANYVDTLSEYSKQFIRSIIYAGIATLACLLLGYPLAYAIAFKAGRWKNLMLVAVIAPFFTSFLIRTLSWQLILGDQAWVADILRGIGLLGEEGHLMATPLAVVTGITYNFLPFMVLPLYASLEKIDPRLHEAGADLYASPFTTFRKVTVPLSMPGVVAGTLLTFIPAAGDYINAQLLGNPQTTMIGNVIQNLFDGGSYPEAAALSVTLMAAIVVMVLVYINRAGTEELV
ncbi:ABC transporter permease [Nocardioides agariphilus]|jgi:spermidine/putrescine transport system permease protein|uniref:ABC transporter permease n=1 Tax=Nocardioides agariphilus TaxID=433664 RepID=A0A930YP95_9ACTN|nr:ABC transporter permease [Nocardioides agariphilus]MBF4770009.1 ABC transporter permease [Nocardioides agariphilus]